MSSFVEYENLYDQVDLKSYDENSIKFIKETRAFSKQQVPGPSIYLL